MCFNRKVVAGLAVAGLGVLLVAPHLVSRIFPILLVAACPLSMVVMMRSMKGGASNPTGGHGFAAPPAGAETAQSEVARLRSEIDQLRADLDGRRDQRDMVATTSPATGDDLENIAASEGN
jgi:hypothetical protein